MLRFLIIFSSLIALCELQSTKKIPRRDLVPSANDRLGVDTELDAVLAQDMNDFLDKDGNSFRCQKRPISQICLEARRIRIPLNTFALRLFRQTIAIKPAANDTSLPATEAAQMLLMLCTVVTGEARDQIISQLNLPADLSCDRALQIWCKAFNRNGKNCSYAVGQAFSSAINLIAVGDSSALRGQNRFRSMVTGKWADNLTNTFGSPFYSPVSNKDTKSSATGTTLEDMISAATNGAIKDLTIPAKMERSASTETLLITAQSAILRRRTNRNEDPGQPTPGPFFNADGTQTTVMYYEETLSAAVYDSGTSNSPNNFRLIRLEPEESAWNYGGTSSFIYIQPKDDASSKSTADRTVELLAALTPEILEKAVAKAKNQSIILQSPSPVIDSTTDLKEPLKKLGLVQMFQAGNENVPAVSSFLQRVKISYQPSASSTTKTKTIASSATSTTIRLDRPSIQMIYHDETGLYLNFVRVASFPASSQASSGPTPPPPASPPPASGFQCPQNQTISAACSDALIIQPAINNYAFNLLKEVADSQTGNFVVLSLHTSTALMQLCYAATDSAVRNEIRKALNLPDSVGCKEAYQLIMKVYRNTPYKGEDVKDDDITYPVNILATDVDPPSRWTKNFTKEFNQTIEPLLLELEDKSPSAVAEHFNMMVSQATRKTVNRIVTAEQMKAVQPSDTLVVNGHSLQSSWKYPFDDLVTVDKFYNGDGSESTADYMRLKAPLMVYETPNGNVNYRVFRLPNKYNTASVVFVQPLSTTMKMKQNDLTKVVLPSFTPDILAEALQKAQEKVVYLSMPKFGVELQTDMKASLQNLGVKQLFLKEGNLPKVGAFYHKAKFVVEEQRVSSRDPPRRSAPKKVAIEIKLDHPFLFFTRLEGTGFMTYMGRVSNLTAGSPDLDQMWNGMLKSVSVDFS